MIQKFVQGQRQPMAYSLFSLFVSLVLAVVFCVVYSKQTADASAEESARVTEQKLCRLVLVLDSAYARNPPSSEPGRNVATSVHELRMSLRCDENTK